jgi:hypothetical protein
VWPTGPSCSPDIRSADASRSKCRSSCSDRARRRTLALLDTAAPTFDPLALGADWLDAQWLAKIAREIEEFLGFGST